MLDDKDISINRSLKMWKNLPIDSRQYTKSLAKLDEYISYPWVGMLFYSEEEDDFYKVISLEDGYKSIRTNKVVRREEMGDVAGIRPIKGYFIGEYEQLTLKGNIASSIVKAEIREGYLWITFHDGTDVNTGYVLGDPGYSPQIVENEDNNETQYKLDITYQTLSNILRKYTTPNLIGPQGIQGETGLDGKDVEVGIVTTNTTTAGTNASVTITKNTSLSNSTKNVYDFSFTIPRGDKTDIVVDTEISPTSTNPVENRAIYNEIGNVQAILATLTTP